MDDYCHRAAAHRANTLRHPQHRHQRAQAKQHSSPTRRQCSTPCPLPATLLLVLLLSCTVATAQPPPPPAPPATPPAAAPPPPAPPASCPYLAWSGAPWLFAYDNGAELLPYAGAGMPIHGPLDIPAACNTNNAMDAPAIMMKGEAISTISTTNTTSVSKTPSRLGGYGSMPYQAVNLEAVPASACAGNDDDTCSDSPYLEWDQLPASSNVGSATQGGISFWFKWGAPPNSDGTIITGGANYAPLFSFLGTGGSTSLTIFAGQPTSMDLPGVIASLVIHMRVVVNGVTRELAWFAAGKPTKYMDGLWHNIMLIKYGTVPGPGVLLVDGVQEKYYGAPPATTYAFNETASDKLTSLWLADINGVRSVSIGGHWDIPSNSRRFMGGFTFWSLSIWNGQVGPCHALLMYILEHSRLSSEIDPSMLGAAQGYQRLFGGLQPNGSVALTRTGIRLAESSAAPATAAFRTELYRTNPAGSLWADKQNDVLHYTLPHERNSWLCSTAGSETWNTSSAVPSDCQQWSPASLNVTCVDTWAKAVALAAAANDINRPPAGPARAPPPPDINAIKQQQAQEIAAATSTFKKQRSAATAVAATTVAVSTGASVSLSAFVSAVASQAAGALTAMSAEVGVGAATGGVGIQSLVARLQYFALSGSVATNMSDAYLNYAYALEWLNFQVDLTGKSSGAVDPASANAAAAISSGSGYRRRLTSVAGVLNAYNAAEQEWEEIYTQIWDTASVRLLAVAVASVALVGAHWGLLFAWPRLSFLRNRKLPELLVFPKLEVTFWNASLVGVTQAFVMLLAAGGHQASVSGILLGLVAGAYALGLLAVLYLISKRLFWHLDQHELKYTKQQIKTEDEEGNRLVFAALQGRIHGEWGEPVVAAQVLEPQRTQLYLKTGISPIHLCKLIWREAAHARAQQQAAAATAQAAQSILHQGRVHPIPDQATAKSSTSSKSNLSNGTRSPASIHAQSPARTARPGAQQQEQQSTQLGKAGAATPSSKPGPLGEATETNSTWNSSMANAVSPSSSSRKGSSSGRTRGRPVCEGSEVERLEGDTDAGVVASVRVVVPGQKGGKASKDGKEGAEGQDAGKSAADGKSSDQPVEVNMVGVEVQERLGVLFEDYKGTTPWAASFKMVELAYKFTTAIAIGLMTGLAATSGSSTAQLLNWVVFVLQAVYVVAITAVRPHVDLLQGATEIVCLWLEGGSVLCSCLLQQLPTSITVKSVHAYLRIASTVVQILSVIVALLLKLLLAIKVRKRIKVVAEEHKELVRRMEAGEDVQFPPKRPRGTLFVPQDAPPQPPPPPPAPQVTMPAAPAPPPAPPKPAPSAKARPPSKQQQQQQQQPPPQPAPVPQPSKRFWKWGTLQAVAKMIGRPAKPLPPPVMPVDEEEDTLSLPEHTLSQEEGHRPYVAPKPGQAKQNWQASEGWKR